MLRALVLSSLLVVVAACAGKKPATAVPSPAAPVAAHEEAEPTLPPALHAFHDKLAPLWHAAAGVERTRNTCASAAELGTLAGEVDQAGAPTGVDASAWKMEVGELREALGELTKDCTTTQGAHLPEIFASVHHEMHEMIELLPADQAAAAHGEHGDAAEPQAADAPQGAR